MRILFVAATTHEIKSIKKSLLHHPVHKGLEVSFLVLGIGNIRATYVLTEYLGAHLDIDFVCNIGICGYREEKASVVQVARTVFAANGKEMIVPIFFQFSPLVSIESFDLPVINPAQTNESYVDMESYAIAYVCEKKDIPYLMLKVPYDCIGRKTLHFIKDEAMMQLEQNIEYSALLDRIVDYLRGVPTKSDWTEVKVHFRLTFTEYEDCKKLIARYEAMSNKDFMSFFRDNTTLTKKEFLEKLSQRYQ